MKRRIFTNAKIVLTDRIVQGAIVLENGKIKKIYEGNMFGELGGIDVEGRYIVPGFIDVHIHGADGADVMDNSVDALNKISKFVVKHGTTNFLATTLTSSKETLKEVLEKIGELQHRNLEGATIFGAHMEGPYFDSEFKGAQNDKYIKSAGIDEIREYLGIKNGLVKLFSLSPNGKESLESIKYLVENGVVVSVGHSGVTFDQVIEATHLGLSHSTHTFNGMKGFNHRDPGVAGAVMLSRDINAEIIFDKIHVHPEAVRLLIKAKGVDKVVCITDAMRATGLTEGNYKLGELDVYVKDNQARLVSNGALAGSVLTMDRAFKHLIELGYSIFDAVKMTSTNAAREFNLNCGVLQEGKDADIVILNSDYSVELTMVKGDIKYQA